ncbi:MAG TPA: hypothetical protein VHL78_11670 [Actinomycetota bacterium]|nr:hypothetical protein [Actinomycetota bacterium]
MMRRLQDERGIAALTVLMVTSALAVAGAVVTFTASTEVEIAGRDRRAEEAFTAAEAGLEMAVGHFTQNVTFSEGQTFECLNNPLVDDAVEYREPTTGEACGVHITSPTSPPGRIVVPATGSPFLDYNVVSRAQEGRTVNRVLAASFHLETLDIPFGMFIDGDVDLNGTAKLFRESMLVTGSVTSRNNMNTDANTNRAFDDPDLGWAFHKDRIVSDPAPGMCVHNGQSVGCAAVFSNAQIYAKQGTKPTDEIHAASSDPAVSSFPHDRDYTHQGKVDSSGEKALVVTLPTGEVIEAMDQLKELAEIQALYFNFKNGRPDNVQLQPADIGAPAREFAENVVIYIDADADDQIGWKINLIPGSTSSDIRYTNDSGQRVGSLSGIIVVRGGSLRLEANTQWSGALFVPENEVRILGGAICTCTIYAKGFSAQGGNSTIQLTDEWFLRFPAGLVSILRTRFLECEAFQPSAVCPAS